MIKLNILFETPNLDTFCANGLLHRGSTNGCFMYLESYSLVRTFIFFCDILWHSKTIPDGTSRLLARPNSTRFLVQLAFVP